MATVSLVTTVVSAVRAPLTNTGIVLLAAKKCPSGLHDPHPLLTRWAGLLAALPHVTPAIALGIPRAVCVNVDQHMP